MFLIVYVFCIVNTQHFSNPEAGFRQKQHQKLVPQIGTMFQQGENVIFFNGPPFMNLLRKIATKCLFGQMESNSCRIDEGYHMAG